MPAPGLTYAARLFDLAPIGYFVLDPGGVTQVVNAAGARLVGLERVQVLRRRMESFLAPGDRPTFAALLGRLSSTGPSDRRVEVCDVELVRGGLCVHLTGTLLGGRSPIVLLAMEDTTERRRAESALERESRHKDEFLSALSHELRSPLTPIRNNLSILERVLPLGPGAAGSEAGGVVARRALEVIVRQVDHLARIVDDLLEVARIARGQVQLALQRVELGELLRRTAEDHWLGFADAGLRLLLQLGQEPLWLDADPTRLLQVFENLLDNANKFTPRGGWVEVAARRDGPVAIVSVRDSGAGIDPEVCAQLFEPFRQAPQSLDRQGGGLGLGLATVRGLVELHGGRVGVFSRGLGQGAEFTVRLPLAEPPPPAAASGPGPADQVCRVLIIEDNEDAAVSLGDLLELDGHEVRVAADGAAGLAIARDYRPEVVICDIGLPDMDGYAVARALRAEEALRGAHLIALSGYALPDDLQRAAEAGFDRHLAKPPRLDKLYPLRPV